MSLLGYFRKIKWKDSNHCCCKRVILWTPLQWPHIILDRSKFKWRANLFLESFAAEDTALTHAGRSLPAVHVVSPDELLPLAARASALLLRGHAQAQTLRREGEVLHLELVILAPRDVCWLDGGNLDKISEMVNFISNLESSDFSSIQSELREYCRRNLNPYFVILRSRF